MTVSECCLQRNFRLTRWCDTLGEHDDSLVDMVRDKNSDRMDTVFLGNPSDLRIFTERRAGGAERRVRFEENTLVVTPFFELVLGVVRVQLDLSPINSSEHSNMEREIGIPG